MEGLEKGFFYRKEDGSVWADLTGEGLDHKLLLRADGTSLPGCGLLPASVNLPPQGSLPGVQGS